MPLFLKIFIPVLFAVDRISKVYFLNLLKDGSVIWFIKPWAGLILVLNQGAAFGLFQGKVYILALISLAVLIGLIYFYKQEPQKTFFWNLAFGFLDLSQKYWEVGVVTGITMFIFAKMQASTFKRMSHRKDGKRDDSFQAVFARNMQTQMVYFFPVISGISAAILPSVLGVYWATNNILNILQDIYIKRKLNIEGFIKKHQDEK